MRIRKAVFHIILAVIINTNLAIASQHCEDNCDHPWLEECHDYCASQGIALRDRSFSNALIYIGWRKGIFKQVGLKAAVAYYGEDQKVIDSLLSFKKGNPIFGLVNAKIATGQIMKGYPIKNIISVENKMPWVPVGWGKPTEIKGLKGTNLGVPYSETMLPEIYAAYRAYGANLSPVKQPDFEDAIKTKKIDWGVLPIADAFWAKQKGLTVPALDVGLIPKYLTSSIIVNEKFKAKNRSAYIKFSSAMLKAISFFYENKNETINILTKELSPVKMSKKQIEFIYDFYKSNNVFSKDGKITYELFNPLRLDVTFEKAVDLSYLEAAVKGLK